MECGFEYSKSENSSVSEFSVCPRLMCRVRVRAEVSGLSLPSMVSADTPLIRMSVRAHRAEVCLVGSLCGVMASMPWREPKNSRPLPSVAALFSMNTLPISVGAKL